MMSERCDRCDGRRDREHTCLAAQYGLTPEHIDVLTQAFIDGYNYHGSAGDAVDVMLDTMRRGGLKVVAE